MGCTGCCRDLGDRFSSHSLARLDNSQVEEPLEKVKSGLEGSYYTAGKRSPRALARFPRRNRQVLFPMVKEIEQARLLIQAAF